MFRTVILSMALLLGAAAVSADDPVVGDAAAHQTVAKNEQLVAAKQNQEEQPKVDADSKKEGSKPEGDVEMSGMSILGNDEAPKSLVIVPWKSSQLGDMPGLSKLLDDSTQPVDKEVFMRELAYYQIRSNSK
jgi:hypothetical protein